MSSLTSNIQQLDLSIIRPSALNPRKAFPGIEDLANDIQLFGVQQPITVRPMGEQGMEIILGERRFRACQLLGLATIPAIVIEATDADVVDRALSENLQRENLSPVEIAQGLQSLLSLNPGLTQESLAARHRITGGPSRVSNLLRLLSLPELVQAALTEGKLTEGHGTALCSLEGHPEAQIALAARAVESESTVTQLREAVRVNRDQIRQAESNLSLPLQGSPSESSATTSRPTPAPPSKPAASEDPKPAPSGASELPPKDDNGLTRGESDKQFAESQKPDPDVPPLSSLPTPPAPPTPPTTPAPAPSGDRVTTSISMEADDWLFEIGLTLDEALDLARKSSLKTTGSDIEFTELAVKCLKALTDDYNDKHPAAPVSASECLEAILSTRAELAGFNIKTLEEIPL
jgi:ParB/RepB/Spo0J family partition protein